MKTLVGNDLFAVLQQEADAYVDSLHTYIHAHRARSLLQYRIDHCAIKARDTAEYEKFMTCVQPQAEWLSYIREGGRRLAAARLPQPLDFGDIGSTHWLEIMEPRPEKAGTVVTGFEHVELFSPDLYSVERTLKTLAVDYEREANAAHEWLMLPLDETHELKVTDRHLLHIIRKELRGAVKPVVLVHGDIYAM